MIAVIKKQLSLIHLNLIRFGGRSRNIIFKKATEKKKKKKKKKVEITPNPPLDFSNSGRCQGEK